MDYFNRIKELNRIIRICTIIFWGMLGFIAAAIILVIIYA